MEFRILGALEVTSDGQVVALPQPKARAVLAYLLLHANEVVPTDVLVDAVWGERPPRTVTASLQNYVSRLRRALGADVLVSRAPGYVLRVEPEQIDLRRAERLIAEARLAEPDERTAKLRDALALWRGPALGDLLYEPFAYTEAPRLDELRLTTLEDRIDAELALGHGSELVAELEGLVATHPLRERFRGQLMVALYRAGRQADALEAYQQARTTLVEELGIEPSPALRRLEAAILRQDDGLGPVRGVPSRARRRDAPTAWRRRTVTVLFAELTATGDPEAARGAVAGLLSELDEVATGHGAVVHHIPGDAAMAVFGVPAAHEDDALRAARAAAEVRAAYAALPARPLELRIGVNTGEVLTSVGEDDVHVSGEPVAVAKRLAQAAGAGEVLLAPSTRALVRDAVATEVTPGAPGRAADAQPAFRLLDVVDAPSGVARALDTPLVGREVELRRLVEAYEHARDERRCRLVAIAGDPGIGKTRLALALADSAGAEAHVLLARCPSYGSGATYRPIAQLVEQATADASLEQVLAGAEDARLVASRIAELTGQSEGALAAGEAFWAVRRFVEALARTRPLVLVLDDLHWAEPTLLELVDFLHEQIRSAPVLVVATGRSELLEARPGWTEAAIVLDLLPEHEAHALIDRLAPPDLPGETRARVVETAEGNPLFVEQLLAFTAESGSTDTLPPTLDALIVSRLDRLAPAERTAAERAAVVGREFTAPAVVALAPEEGGAVRRHLAALAQRGLIRPARSSPAEGDGFRFHHALIRDAAYAGIPKATRAELHERLADWLDERGTGTDELVGSHLEEAFRFHTELGAAGGATRRLAADAGIHLGRAGIRAFKRGDVAATVNLLERATGLLPVDDGFRRELLCELGLALRTAGELERAERTLRAALVASQRSRDRRVELRARMELAFVLLFADPHGRARELVDLGEAAIPTFEAVGDDRSLGRAWLLLGTVRGSFLNQYAAHEQAAERAVVHYVRSGWPPAYARGDIGTALFFGPRPAGEALRRCRELLAEAGAEGPVGEAHLSVWAAGLHAMRGEVRTARDRIEHARRLLGDLGHAVSATYECDSMAVFVDMLEGDLVAAERRLRTLCDFSEQRHEYAHLASHAADLSHVLQQLGRVDEAAEWADVAEAHAAEDDSHAQYRWRSARAKLLARRRDLGDAVALARSAAEIASRTDALGSRADVLLDLADVLRSAGDDDEAARVSEEAIALYERKGNTVAAERARADTYRAALAE